MAGRLFAIVGPSGGGKDTLMAAAQTARPGLHLARRVITRPETAGGEPFEGVGAEEFARRAASGAFALHLITETQLDWVWRFGAEKGRAVDKLVFRGIADFFWRKAVFLPVGIPRGRRFAFYSAEAATPEQVEKQCRGLEAMVAGWVGG